MSDGRPFSLAESQYVKAAIARRQLRPNGIVLDSNVITDIELFARLADDEQVTGQYTFTQDLDWQSGTGNTASQEHANTAPRVYTWPDKDGTVAMLSDLSTEVIKSIALGGAVDESPRREKHFGWML